MNASNIRLSMAGEMVFDFVVQLGKLLDLVTGAFKIDSQRVPLCGIDTEVLMTQVR